MKTSTGSPVTFTELRLKNFRAFEDARLRFGDLTALVGRNGSGKSTILEAVDFFRDAVSDSVLNALERRGGLPSIRRRQAAKRPYDVSLAMEMKVGKTRFLYGFKLGASGSGSALQIKEESLSNDGDYPSFHRTVKEVKFHGIRSGAAVSPESLLLPNLASEDKYWMRIFLFLRRMRTYTLAPSVIREEPSIGEGNFLKRDGSNTGDVLKELQSDRVTMHWILSRLSEVAPGVVGAHADASSAGRRLINFQRTGPTGEPQTFPSGLMSDGTLRCLAVLLALRQKPPASLIVIDEIEDSIHPAAIGVLLDAIAETTDRSQIVITSHSPEALSHPAINGDRIRVLDWSDGTSKLFELSSNVIAYLNPPQTVGKLLRSNALWTQDRPATVGTHVFDLAQ